MAPVYRLADPTGVYTDISSYFRLYQLDVSMNAEEGSVNQSTIQADDPTGVFDIVGTRRLVISDDTASSSNTRIWDGYVAGRRIHRGDSQLTSAARVWDIDLVDINSLLARRVITGTDANRPAETDVARVQWLYGSNENAHITDSLYLNTVGPIAMDAADYRGQRFNQVLDDCAQASGKNYFVWWREEVAKLSLWYDFGSSTSYSSPLRLSNVSTDVDSILTFAISPDTELSRSPDRVNSGAYLPFDGGAVYVQNTATANSFVRRDANMPSENVKSTAKATARANRYLLEMDTEEDVITTTVQLPAAKVNFIMQGMRVQFKASHLPGYEAYTWTRVLNRSVQQVSEEFYDVKMELSVSIGAACLSIVQTDTQIAAGGVTVSTLPAVAAAGDTMVAIISRRALYAGTLPTAWDVPGAFPVAGTGYTLVGNVEQSYDPVTHRAITVAKRTATGTDTDSVGWSMGSSTGPVLMVMEFAGSTGITGPWSTTGTPVLSMSLSGIVAPGPGYIVLAFSIIGFDIPPNTLTLPAGMVALYNGRRDGGFDWVSMGYIPVATAGTYSATWVASNTYDPFWTWEAIAVFVSGDSLC